MQIRAQAERERRLRQASKAADPSSRLSLWDWQWRHRHWLKPKLAFDIEHHRYLEGIYKDDGHELVLCKSAQSGLSEWAVSRSLHACDELNATVLYVFPDDGLVSDFSSARLGTALDASTYLESIVRAANVRGADRITLKRVRDRFLYLRGATVDSQGKAAQLKSIDADVVILDEYDEMDKRVEPLARERLGHSSIADFLMISTPTYAGMGIHAQYMASDQRQWFVACGHCGNRQTPALDDMVMEWDDLERPLAWHAANGAQKAQGFVSIDSKVDWERASEPVVICRKCQRVLDRTGSGEWVPAFPTRKVHGYHISRLFVAQKPLTDIVDGLMSTDDTKRQQVFNQGLGLTYRSTNSKSLTDEILDACRRDYAFGPKPRQGAFCGIDVGRVLHVVIRGADWGLRYVGTMKDFDEVEALLTDYGVLCVVVDANPETRSARQFQAKHDAGFVWLAYYADERGDKTIEPIRFNENDLTVHASRTRSLDSTLAQFRLGAKGEARGATLPANARDIADYYAQMKAPERQVEEKANGKRVAVYVEKGADHYAHSENYAFMAATYWLRSAENHSQVVYDPVRIADY